MANMKTEFQLEGAARFKGSATATIVHTERPYVCVHVTPSKHSAPYNLFFQDKDLERFAVNILKALGSKKLKK